MGSRYKKIEQSRTHYATDGRSLFPLDKEMKRIKYLGRWRSIEKEQIGADWHYHVDWPGGIMGFTIEEKGNGS